MTTSATPSNDEDANKPEGANQPDNAADSGESGEGRTIPKAGLDRSDESQDFVDQSKIDFDPDDGLYSGTAVTGDTDIPGAHVGDDGEIEDDGSPEAKAALGEDPEAAATEGDTTEGDPTEGKSAEDSDSDD